MLHKLYSRKYYNIRVLQLLQVLTTTSFSYRFAFVIIVVSKIYIILPTLPARVGFHASMDLHMCFNTVEFWKPFPTHLTAERLLPSMDTLVSLQISIQAKALSTRLTFVRFFISVSLHVHFQRARPLESFPACYAFIRSIS